VIWVNQDSAPRGVEATQPAGAFNSGSIAPGASWSFVFNTKGSYQYSDSTRTWVVGTLNVQ